MGGGGGHHMGGGEDDEQLNNYDTGAGFFQVCSPNTFFFVFFCFVFFVFFYGEDKPSTSAQVRDAGKVDQELTLDALILFIITGLSQAPLHTLPLTAGMLIRNI